MVTLQLEVGGSRLTIVSRGAYVTRWVVNGKDVLTPGNLDRPTRSGMALLIPFANRVRGGEYVFEGIRYSLPTNEEGHAIHGLVLNEEWDIESIGGDNVKLKHVLVHRGYPSELTTTVNYLLGERELRVRILVRNTGSRNAPLVVGAHPYFVVSNDWRLRIEGESRICRAVNKIPTGELMPYDLNNPDRRDFDDCFLVYGKITLESQYSTVEITRQNMPYIQIYTGEPNAIAIEPMSGAPDAYHNGLGLIVIRPGEEKVFSFTMRVLRI